MRAGDALRKVLGGLLVMAAAVSAQPQLSVSETSLEFGIIAVGETAVQTVVLMNTGDVPLTGRLEIVPSGPAVFDLESGGPSDFSVVPQGNLSVTLLFAPGRPWRESSSLSISSNDPNRPLFNVTLLGTGVTGQIRMELAGSMSDPIENAYAVQVQNAFVYLADYNARQFRIINIGDPTLPHIAGADEEETSSGPIQDVVISGHIACVAAGPALEIYDVSGSDGAAVFLSRLDGFDFIQDLVVTDEIVYVADRYAGLKIVDVTDPIRPVLLGTCGTPGSANGIAISGSTAYVADGASGLRIIDISSPNDPCEVGFFDTPGSACAVVFRDNKAYIADGTQASGLVVVDVSHVRSPRLVVSVETPGNPQDVVVDGDIVWVADYDKGVLAIDLSLPDDPVFAGGSSIAHQARGLLLSDGVLHVAGGQGGYYLFNCESIQPPETENTKDPAMFTDREVFLVSDADWRQVLPLVSVSTWRQVDSIRYTHPALLYHQESDAFDADAVIAFLQQYGPTRLTILGETPGELDALLTAPPELGAGLEANQIRRLAENSHPDFWEQFRTLVYVEDDYATALTASSLASLENAPLIIAGTPLDRPDTYVGRHVICVGAVTPPQTYASAEWLGVRTVQRRVVEATDTDKILLVNPGDLFIAQNETFAPEKSIQPIQSLYTNTSLAAPFLAAAREELLVTVPLPDAESVDAALNDVLSRFEQSFRYLTIVASPDAIQMTMPPPEDPDIIPSFLRHEVDNHIYGNTDDDAFQELAVGRIFGVSPADASVIIARSVFYNAMAHPQNAAVICPDLTSGFINPGKAVERLLVEGEWIVTSYFEGEDETPFLPSDLEDQKLVTCIDHGSALGWGGEISTFSLRDYQVWMTSPMVLTEACATIAYDNITPKGDLFAANVLRRGVVAYIGAVDSYAPGCSPVPMLLEQIMHGADLGTAFKEAKNQMVMIWKMENIQLASIGSSSRNPEYDKQMVLLGDPTLEFDLTYPDVPYAEIRLTEEGPAAHTIDLSLPALEMALEREIQTSYWTPGVGYIPAVAHERYFAYPLGEPVASSSKGMVEIRDIVSDELLDHSTKDVGRYCFSVTLPEGIGISSVSQTEYVDANTTVELTQLPVFTGESSIENFVTWAQDSGDNNAWFFYFGAPMCVWSVPELGGDPPIVESVDVIPEYTYRIYLNTGKGGNPPPQPVVQPAVSGKVAVDIQMKKTFLPADRVAFACRLVSDVDQTVLVLPGVQSDSGPSYIFPPQWVELKKGQPRLLPFSGPQVSLYQTSAKGTAFVEMFHPFRRRITETFAVKRPEVINLDVVTASADSPKIPQNVFSSGQAVQASVETDVKDVRLRAVLTVPDGRERPVTLPLTFRPVNPGSYTLRVHAARKGFQQRTVETSFAVIAR